jgi:hypothetical protein
VGRTIGLSVKIPYKEFPLTSAEVVYSAILNVQIARSEKNSPRSKRFETIIDSGASRCLFHSAIAKSIGIDVAGLLGMAGFFENFKVTFDPEFKHCEIEQVHRT